MSDNRKSKIFADRRNWVKSIARRRDFHSSTKVVAYTISEFCNPKTAEAFASVSTIAEASGFSERTTSSAIRQMVEEGVLLKRPPRQGRNTNTYKMLHTQAEKSNELTKIKAKKAKSAIKGPSSDHSFANRYQDWMTKITAELGGTIEGFVILQEFDDDELREAFSQSIL